MYLLLDVEDRNKISIVICHSENMGTSFITPPPPVNKSGRKSKLLSKNIMYVHKEREQMTEITIYGGDRRWGVYARLHTRKLPEMQISHRAASFLSVLFCR